jgi:hypothetical protein
MCVHAYEKGVLTKMFKMIIRELHRLGKTRVEEVQKFYFLCSIIRWQRRVQS